MKELVLKHFNNNVCILQLENLQHTDRIESYIKSLQEGSIMLMGEYVVNDFFCDSMESGDNPTTIQGIDSKANLRMLCDISKAFKHTIIAPFIERKNKGYYKNMAVIANGKIHSYQQQRLIHFPHWNESGFFSNDTTKLIKLPFTFIANNVRFGVLFGFEAHFDEFWMEFKKANVDVVLISTASTFLSQKRWQNIFSSHAFTNSCYVFRANRVGTHMAIDGSKWDFYGDSFVYLGHNMIDSLGDSEGMLCVELDKDALIKIKSEWGFR